ncbi:MAG TPA: squalene--hopene cyclase [Actinocrinis sp.]|jgi:squalene-hopene/tetraprenyl-beta-curcumene cyclase|uniref:squalene--hopene cyclase n=1 Tax=Actinocrinis sp. TaxID=1920516 RepID=UPI002DDD4BB0|nr:squalene--hopene cyclase [Actinocrinis sp.]HEV3169697.1 squalene--hopene cyclase [Actinocrinis sp.]
MTAIAERQQAQGAQPGPLAAVRKATEGARDHLLALQDTTGWWKGELATNVTMDAEDLLLREFLGIRTVADSDAAARWIRSQQREDGTWATFHGGPPELSTTVEAYVALKLAGDAPDAPHMKVARDWIQANGGVEATRVFTRIWLALFGLWDWERLPVMPPELVFLPPQVPLNIYDWGCWARQTVVPLTVVAHFKPVRPIPIGIDELRTGAPDPATAPLASWAGLFQRADRALHVYDKLHRKPGRKAALRRAVEWIVARQEADGGWGGIQPPWVYSIMALHLMGYQLDHPVIRTAIEGLEGFMVREESPDGPVRRLEACQSPVWDTALAVVALTDAGVPGDHPAIVRAADWLLDEEITVPGDWSVRRPGLKPGGWAFEFANDGYPDTDDTAEVVIALRRAARDADEDRYQRLSGAIDRGTVWMAGMQSKDGGWGAFDADNTRELITKLPFCDFGAVIDPPSADVTAHIVEAFALEGKAHCPESLRGIRWLLDHQEKDGSWYGRWGANHVYGTGAAVPALVEAGVARDHPAIRRAAAWLIEHQNPDGGWGEDLRSYKDKSWIGRGESTASQTAWAMLALLAAQEEGAHPRAEAVRAAADRGAAYLAATQRADGTWDEELFTGTGFPGDFYINYHLYRLVFPLTALGRYLADRLVEAT